MDVLNDENREIACDSEIMELTRFLHPLDSTQRMVCVLRAYFDDSGTHRDSRVVVIGGCVAREKQWEEFGREWSEMLTYFGIKEFHSVDLQAFQGDFEGWNEDRRRQLIARTMEIGQHWAKSSFVSAVVRADYQDVVPNWAKESAAFGDEYNFCFQMSIGRIDKWIDQLDPPMPPSDQIAFVFDQQPKRIGVTRDTYSAIKKFRDRDRRMGALAFVSGEQFLPLQFADFIAYEAYKQLDGILSKPGWQTRTPLKMIVQNLQYLEMTYFGREQLEPLVRYYDEKGRPERSNEPWWPWFPENG